MDRFGCNRAEFLHSLLNSHLFDFTEGWLYVLSVGIAGGTVYIRAPNIYRLNRCLQSFL